MAAALAGLLLMAASSGLHGVVEHAFEAAGGRLGRHPVAGVLAFTGLAAMSAMFAFFSSAVVVPVGVQNWGGLLTGVLLWVGWLIGGATSYAIRPGRRARAGAPEHEELASESAPPLVTTNGGLFGQFVRPV